MGLRARRGNGRALWAAPPPQRSRRGVPRRLHGARGGAASAAHPSPPRERQSHASAMGMPPGLFPFLVSSQSRGRNPSHCVHSNTSCSFSFRHSLFLPIHSRPRRPLNYPRHLSTHHLQPYIFPHCDQTISNTVLQRYQGPPLGIPKRLWRPFRRQHSHPFSSKTRHARTADSPGRGEPPPRRAQPPRSPLLARVARTGLPSISQPAIPRRWHAHAGACPFPRDPRARPRRAPTLRTHRESPGTWTDAPSPSRAGRASAPLLSQPPLQKGRTSPMCSSFPGKMEKEKKKEKKEKRHLCFVSRDTIDLAPSALK